jgi:hypothetical protein
LDKLHSLEPNAASIEMIRELRRNHQALVEQMPPDVSAALSPLNNSFVAEHKTAEVKALEDEYRQSLSRCWENFARSAQIKSVSHDFVSLTANMVCSFNRCHLMSLRHFAP